MVMIPRATSRLAFALAAGTLGLAAALVHASLVHADDVDTDAATVARAQQALGPFKRALKQALTQGMSEGPVHAIGACNTKAPTIATTHSKPGVRVGRASHRLRNPANAAPDWVQPILDAYVADASSRTPRVARLSGDRAGYVEPIHVQPLCITCHGEALAPDVATRIRALYPDDRATGFEVGDLRGVWWVELASE